LVPLGAGLGFPCSHSGAGFGCVSAIIYFPFFKVYEKQLLQQEAEEAQRNGEEENQQVA
jgi:hypothetical protein